MFPSARNRPRSLTCCLAALLLCTIGIGVAGCTEAAFLNLTSPLGEGTVGSRGSIQVTFVNNTPYRALFYAATFNAVDQTSVPHNPVPFGDGTQNDQDLEGNTVLGPFTFQCDRVMSLGGIQMLERLTDTSDPNDLIPNLTRTGIGFSGAAAGDPLATLPTEGTAEPLDILQGYSFPCEALITVTFEEDADAPGGFVATYEVILPP